MLNLIFLCVVILNFIVTQNWAVGPGGIGNNRGENKDGVSPKNTFYAATKQGNSPRGRLQWTCLHDNGDFKILPILMDFFCYCLCCSLVEIVSSADILPGSFCAEAVQRCDCVTGL